MFKRDLVEAIIEIHNALNKTNQQSPCGSSMNLKVMTKPVENNRSGFHLSRQHDNLNIGRYEVPLF